MAGAGVNGHLNDVVSFQDICNRYGTKEISANELTCEKCIDDVANGE